MPRRIPVVTAMLITTMALAVFPASADPILIEGGSMIVDRTFVGTVDIHGTQGFRLQLRLGVVSTNGPWTSCCPARPGTSIDLSGFAFASDGGGVAELNGIRYSVPSDDANVILHLLGDHVTAPPLSTSAVLSAPFKLSSTSNLFLFHFPDEGESTVFPIVGRGTATIELIPHPAGDPFWEFSRVRYEFSDAQPVPEPATLLLFGTGMLALAAKRHRRRSGAAAKPIE